MHAQFNVFMDFYILKWKCMLFVRNSSVDILFYVIIHIFFESVNIMWVLQILSFLTIYYIKYYRILCFWYNEKCALNFFFIQLFCFYFCSEQNLEDFKQWTFCIRGIFCQQWQLLYICPVLLYINLWFLKKHWKMG